MHRVNAQSGGGMRRTAVRGLLWLAAVWALAACGVFYMKRPLHLLASWPWYSTPEWVALVHGEWLAFPWGVAGQGLLFLWIVVVLAVCGADMFGRFYRGARLIECVVWGGGLMLGMLGMAVFFLGVAGWIGWRGAVFWILLGGMTLRAVWLLAAWGRGGGLADFGRTVRRVVRDFSFQERLLGLLALGVFGVAWFYALTPSVQSDALRYHLAGPQEWLKAGRLVYLPYNAFTSFPSTVDMLFLFGLGLAEDLLAKCFHFVFFPLSAGAVGLMARELWQGEGRLWGIRPFLLAAAAWGLSPLVVPLAGWGFIDLGVLFFTLGTVFFLVRWTRTSARRDWVLSAVFAGLLCGSKYTGVLVAMWGGVCLVVFDLARMGWRGNWAKAFGRAVVYGLCAAAVVAPWWVKNLAQTGNPVYPMASGIFPGGEWTPANQAFLQAKAGEKGSRSLATAPGLPWNTAVFPERYGGFTLGPLYWVMLAWWGGWVFWALVRGRRRPAAAMLAAWLVFSLVFWFFTYQSNRFLLPASALGAVAVVLALGAAGRVDRFAALVGTGGLVLALGYNTADSVRWLLTDAGQLRVAGGTVRSHVRWPAFTLGYLSREDYLRSQLNYYDCARFCNRHLADGHRVLLLGEHRKMHWQCSVEGSDWFDIPRIRPFLRQASDADHLIDLLRASGFTHVFFNLDEWGWPAPEGGQGGPAWQYNRTFLSDSDVLKIDELLHSPRLFPVHATRSGRVFVARLAPRS